MSGKGLELGTAYISLAISSKDVPKQVKQSLSGVPALGDAAGASLGERMSAGFGTALKAGVVGAGAAVVAAGTLAVGTALTKGFQRLTAIDDAKAKLEGLRHSTESIASIMDSALASVKGTAFGLGEAATISASAVAAGIQPGQELTKYLSLTGDAATIAGTSLEEMGAVINKVQTKGKAYTLDLNQLATRGIPIYQWLAKEYGVTQEALGDMVAEGKVDAVTYRKVIEENIGGAARAGNSVSAAWSNTMAGMGRIGAAALKPTFDRTADWLKTATGGIDALTPKVDALAVALDNKIFEDWGPRLKTAFEEFRQTDFAIQSVSKMQTIFYGLKDAAMDVWPAVQGIGAALGKAAATAAGAGFSLLLDALNGLVPIISGVLVPGIKLLSDLMSANQGVVTGLLMAYAGFKLISFLGATKSMQSLSAASTGAFTSMRNGLKGVGETQRMFASAGTQVSKFGASMAYLSTGSGSVGKMASSFRTAESSVGKFGRTLGAAAAAGKGLQIAGRNIFNALGGAQGLISAAVIGGLIIFGQQSQKAAEHQRELKQAAEGLGKALYESNGALNATTQRAAATALETSKLAGSGKSLVEFLEGVGVSGGTAAKGLAGGRLEMQETLKVLEEQARIEAEINKERVGKGSEGFASSALGSLFNIGGAKDKANEAANALADFKKLDEEARKLAESQKRLSLAAGFIDASGTSTALGTMSETMKRFEDSTGGAASKVDLLNGGLSTLRGDAMSVETAQKQVNDALRGFATASAEAGAGAVDSAGKINTQTAAGSQLFDAMGQVAAAFDNAGAAAFTAEMQQSNSVELAAAAAEAAGQRVRDEFIAQQVQSGKTLEAATALADQYKLFPDELKTNVSVTGVPKAGADLDSLKGKLDLIQSKKVVIDVVTQVQNAGIEVAPWISAIGGGFTGKRLPQNSAGSRLPTSGPGTDTVDGILGVGADGVPTSWVDAGEWIINSRSSEKYNGLLAAINRDDPRLRDLPAYAEGGRNGITNALSAGASVNGNKYLWGGTGPTNFDCSGFVGWLHQIVMGVTGSVKRLYTTMNLLGSTGVGGLQRGLGPAGTQFQVGVSQEHMAATVGGHSAESGGAHGTSGLDNGRANAQSAQFPHKWHLPNSLIAGYSEASTSQSTWTQKQELDLKSADVAVTQAREALGQAQIDLGEGKKTQADVDQAELKVQKAEQKVLELQGAKDGAKAGPAPQAPELEKAYTKLERERLEAQMQVNDANTRRNEVYADLESTEDDRMRADFALQTAREELAAAANGSGDGKDYSVNGTLSRFLHDGADALLEGIQGQDYFGLGESRWLTTDWKSLAGQGDAPDAAPFTLAQIDMQTGGMSLQQIMEERFGFKPPKVFDTGGWLQPGETAINLSSRPEPIFNSPEQMARFMGGAGNLAPAEPTVVNNDYSIAIGGDMVTADTREMIRELRRQQEFAVIGRTGG